MTEYLTKRGIPPNLPQLDIIYEGLGQVEPSRKFSQSKDRLLQKVPIVTCPAVEGEMYCTLLIDPDAPSPAGDPAEPGKDGPWLHWLVTDYSLAFPQGNILAKYTGPSPTKGTHRYIFLLFRHIAGTEMQVPTTERKQWPFEQFMALNRDHLQPIQMNFFYCDSS